jgi:trk system potassium uptake protein TrkA
MKIVIAGLGTTGYYLAETLLRENHDLILIEKDEKTCLSAQEKLDAKIIEGDASNALTLEPLVEEDTDLFIGVTSNDEANVVATLIARKFGAKRAITRINDPVNAIHPLLTDDPGVYVLNQEMIVAKDIGRLVGNPGADEIDFFAKGKVEMIKIHAKEESSLLSTPLKDLKLPNSWLLIGIIRNGTFRIASGDSMIALNDQVLLIGRPENQGEIEKLMGVKNQKINRVILIGYNEISTTVGKKLRERDIQVRLIEENKEKAEEAAAKLNDVLVFNGDGTSEEVLKQAGVDETDYLIALTDDDENNVLISLLAKEKGVRRVIALTQKAQYKQIIEKIGIDSVVNPRTAMVDEIFRRVHQEHFSEVNILEGGQGQMLEVLVKAKSKIIDVPLAKAKLPKQMLIGAILRDGELIIPHGDDKIEVGDHVVVFSTQTTLDEVKKLFGN